jgi:hypothetical protein
MTKLLITELNNEIAEKCNQRVGLKIFHGSGYEIHYNCSCTDINSSDRYLNGYVVAYVHNNVYYCWSEDSHNISISLYESNAIETIVKLLVTHHK